MKYPRTYHLPWSPGATRDDRIASDISGILNTPVVITEKLDGENCGIELDGVYGRSHEVYTDTPWSAGVRELHASIRPYLDEGLMLFGENMEGVHSIEYNDLESFFYLFGVRDEDEENYFAAWNNTLFYAQTLGICTVPEFVKTEFPSVDKLKRTIDLIMNDYPSMLGGRDTKTGEEAIEGLVIRPMDGFYQSEFHDKVFKWVREGHVEEGEEHWTKNWKRAKLKI